MRGAAALAVVGALVLGGCGLPGSVSGSGVVVESAPELEPFTAVAISSAFEVTVRLGDEQALVLRTDDNIVDRIDISVDSETLTLGTTGGMRNATLQADLTVPAGALTSIALSGAATLTGTEPLTAPSLEVDLDGASRAFLVVQSDDLEVSADGASVVNASGSVASLRASAAGASSLGLDQLAAVSADVEATGASSITVSVSGDLSATASGASSVRYTGDPDTVDQDVSGASTVEPA